MITKSFKPLKPASIIARIPAVPKDCRILFIASNFMIANNTSNLGEMLCFYKLNSFRLVEDRSEVKSGYIPSIMNKISLII
ncbi:hypothetical protein BLOT_009430 [Blomia tropicalis]|nr:hypothetical protein BLOT_009430 [Blomia tropicalis]